MAAVSHQLLVEHSVRARQVLKTDLLERLATPRAWLGWVLLHMVLGVLVTESGLLSTVHMLLVLATVGLSALVATRPDTVLAVTFYAGVSDVLWRASGARGPWEGAKYAIIIGAGALILRFARRPRHGPLMALMVACLVPGAVLTALSLGPGGARGYLVANLLGLVAVAAAVAACGNFRLTSAEFRGIYLVVIGPIAALTASATLGTIRASGLTWTDEVNFKTSAGFGPNQVSSILALGALLCVLIVIQPGLAWRHRVLSMVVAVWMVGQAVLTFSRGGVFGLVLALVAVGITSLITSGQRLRVIVLAVVLAGMGIQIMSWAGAFTEGKAEERFASTDSTNRWDIAKADVDLFWSHPLLGVGAGMGKFKRDFATTAAHTEYSRLLGEHGVFGMGVLVILAVLCTRLVRQSQGWNRMAVVGLLILVLGQMTHSATRIGSIAVTFGLAALQRDTR